ncbi:MAG: hypothetical protein ABEJ99_00430 [Candidatus Nanohaloarchaea archaeon]
MIAENITGDESFWMPINAIPEDILYEVGRQAGVDGLSLPEGSTVEYQEGLVPALNSIDDRRSHERALDAALEHAIERYDDRSYDLILTEVDYDITSHVEENEWGRRDKKDRWYYGEIDMMLVNIDENVVRAVEVKPDPGRMMDENGNPVDYAPTHREKVEKQHQRQAHVFDLLNENVDGFEMYYIAEDPVYESGLMPEFKVPNEYDGRHYWSEAAKEKAFKSDKFLSFVEHFVLPENPAIFADDKFITEERRDDGEFLQEFLEENR